MLFRLPLLASAGPRVDHPMWLLELVISDAKSYLEGPPENKLCLEALSAGYFLIHQSNFRALGAQSTEGVPRGTDPIPYPPRNPPFISSPTFPSPLFLSPSLFPADCCWRL